jgi:hypothetical protein
VSAAGKPIWVRFVLVPGLTDHPDDIAGIAKFAVSLGNVKRVEVLPFHQMGRIKWKQLSMRYRLEDTLPPTQESVAQVCAAFRAEGLEAYCDCRWRIRSQAATGISNRPRCVAIGERLGVRAGSVPGGLHHEHLTVPA